jgi:hypothetical protein
MPEDYFGERVAARYDERYAYESDSAVVDPIATFLADFARAGAALELGIGTGRIALPLAVANTIMNLTTQDEQVACFRNVAAHLEPGGCFVIEVAVPGLRRLPPGETFQPFDVSPRHLGFDKYDVARQGLVSHH